MMTFFIILSSISLGSFGNSLISYFTGRCGLELKRSFCLCGEKKLGAVELMPVLNYLILKGKCRHCRVSLPVRYIVVEVISGLIGLIIYLKYGLSVKFIVIFSFLFTLTIIAVIDYISFIIPNKLLIALALIAAVKSLLMPEDFLSTIMLSISIAVIFALNNLIFFKIKHKEAVGSGDIKLLSILAIQYGYPFLFSGLWLAAATGLIGYSLNKKIWNEKIPFGFFIWIGFILTEMLNSQLMSVYNGLIK